MKTKSVFVVIALMHVRLFAGSDSQAKLTAHEWGTFTSVQGADGVQLEWNPLVTTELPKFVYDRARPGGVQQPDRVFLGKNVLSLQRMETPVIYFYSDRQQKVDVSVQFPQGTVTEWYPQVAKYEPQSMRWDGVEIIPEKMDGAPEKILPLDASGSHYFAARETDADFLRVSNNTGSKPTREHEKFLFYRGVGYFKAPLQASLGATDDTVVLKNSGSEPLSNLYVMFLRHGSGNYVFVHNLLPGKEQTVKLGTQTLSLPSLRTELAEKMAASLVQEGLYKLEAKAMVKTWNDSWFSEEGLRVLYTLPRSWTDRTLPLKISPAPTEVVRVMVGRAEIITPSMEWELMKQIARYGENDSRIREQAVANARAIGLGRFAEAAVRRMVNRLPNREFSQTAWSLLTEMGKGQDKKLALAK